MMYNINKDGTLDRNVYVRPESVCLIKVVNHWGGVVDIAIYGKNWGEPVFINNLSLTNFESLMEAVNE